MKIDAISVAALAVAGVAVFQFTRRANAAPTDPAQQVFTMATQQRREVGAALPANTDYLANWRQLDSVFQSQPDFWV